MAVTQFTPYYRQIADKYADLIAEGVLKPGDPLPTMQQLAGLEGVSHQTAVRAVEYLRAAKLVTTTRSGSVVAPRRLISGAAAQLAGVRFPAAAAIIVNATEFIAAPERIAAIMGLLEVKRGQFNVGRREQVSCDEDMTPFLLEVQWWAPELTEAVPELLGPGALGPGQALELVAERTGRAVNRGWHASEARPILDDGREGPMLRAAPGYVVKADVMWFSSDGRTASEDPLMLLYWEMIVKQGLVTANEFTASAWATGVP
jgi:DNA-binding transcriptional regulator YhcF (GntR family)